jgi:hypothetical protein
MNPFELKKELLFHITQSSNQWIKRPYSNLVQPIKQSIDQTHLRQFKVINQAINRSNQWWFRYIFLLQVSFGRLEIFWQRIFL